MLFLITILALGFVIFFHELGHMMTAKYFGVGVLEFSIGMGPKVISKKVKETVYSIRALPFGGFVKLAGLDDGEDKSIPDEQNYLKKPLYQRFCVISAGSVMNLILGFIVLFGMYAVMGTPQSEPVIQDVMADSPAQSAGLLAGDRILTIEDQPIKKVASDLIQRINASQGKALQLTIDRSGSTQQFTVVPSTMDGKSKKAVIGIVLKAELQRGSLLDVFKVSSLRTLQYAAMVFVNIKMLVVGTVSIQDMAGPIGIVQFASHELTKSFINFSHIIALISISLGVINLFPFPVLDGGHLVFLTLEGITRRKVSKTWEYRINNFGAAILIGLMAYIVFNDIASWATRQTMLETLK